MKMLLCLLTLVVWNVGPLSAQVIRLATVPASMQTTFVSECLLRDRILAKQLADRGWKLQELPFRNGAAMVPQLGDLEVMLMGDTAALVALQKAPLGLFLTTSTGDMTFIAKRQLLPAQLKGLRVGYIPGTVAHFGVWRALSQGDLSFADVTSVPVFADQAEAALASGTIDATSTYEPYSTSILQRIQGSTVVSRFEVRTFLLMNLEFADGHPELRQALLGAVARAARWLRASEVNTTTALNWIQAAQKRFLGSSLLGPREPWLSELRRETLENPSYPMLPQDILEETGMAYQQFGFLREVGQVPADAEWASLVPRIRWRDLSEVLRNPVGWELNRFDYVLAP